MASNILTNFIVPILQVILYISIIGGIVGWLTWIFYKAYKKQWKWTLKYKILRRHYSEEDVTWCFNRIEEGCDYVDVMKIMLVAGKGKDRTNEIVWIFKQIHKEMMKEMKLKGGDLNGRSNIGSSGKNKSRKNTTTELPSGNFAKED